MVPTVVLGRWRKMVFTLSTCKESLVSWVTFSRQYFQRFLVKRLFLRNFKKIPHTFKNITLQNYMKFGSFFKNTSGAVWFQCNEWLYKTWTFSRTYFLRFLVKRPVPKIAHKWKNNIVYAEMAGRMQKIEMHPQDLFCRELKIRGGTLTAYFWIWCTIPDEKNK